MNKQLLSALGLDPQGYAPIEMCFKPSLLAYFKDGSVDILTLLVRSGLCASRGDARRNVEQGGVSAGDQKVTDIARSFTPADIGQGLTLRRGKKNYNRVVLR